MTVKSKKPKKNQKTKQRSHAAFFLNGQLTKVSGDDAFMMLAEWLRKRAQRPGTKIVCAEGDCGACTVARTFEPLNSKSKPKFVSINSCITTVAQMDGSHLVTVEGLEVDGKLSPAQNAMRDCHGSQCGFCTPGFIMALSATLEAKQTLDRKSAANCLTGNLCRCTGYSPILDAAEAIKPSPEHNLASRYLTTKNIQALREEIATPLQLQDLSGRIFYAPDNLKDACSFLAKNKSARLMAASTDLGVQTNKGKPLASALLSLQHVDELYQTSSSKKSLIIGARVSLSKLRKATQRSIPEFANFLDLFASPQIKNSATLVGNLANASPIGDTLPFLLATDAMIHVASSRGGKLTRRKIEITKFFLGYKKLALKPNELITHVEIPLAAIPGNLRLFKSSQRKDLDISAVGAAFNVIADTRGNIKNAQLALGGVAATPIRLQNVEAFMVGKPITVDTFAKATELLNDSVKPLSDVRGSQAYRRVLVRNIFHRYIKDVFNLTCPIDGGAQR